MIGKGGYGSTFSGFVSQVSFFIYLTFKEKHSDSNLIIANLNKRSKSFLRDFKFLKISRLFSLLLFSLKSPTVRPWNSDFFQKYDPSYQYLYVKNFSTVKILKSGKILVVSFLLTVSPIVTCGSRVSCAPTHHTLPAFLNLPHEIKKLRQSSMKWHSTSSQIYQFCFAWKFKFKRNKNCEHADILSVSWKNTLFEASIYS